MTAGQYKVVFRGAVREGFSVETVKTNLAKLFKIDAARVESLFSGNPIVVKQGIDAPTAKRYLAALTDAGAVCEMVPMDSTVASTEAKEATAPAEDDAKPTGHGAAAQKQALKTVFGVIGVIVFLIVFWPSSDPQDVRKSTDADIEISAATNCKMAAANKWLLDFTMANGNPTYEQRLEAIRQVSVFTEAIRVFCGSNKINNDILQAANLGIKPKWIENEINELVNETENEINELEKLENEREKRLREALEVR